MLDLRRQPGPHVFVEDLESLVLADHDRHHLARSLRLRDGDQLTVSDGRFSWRPAVFGDVLVAAGPIVEVAPPTYELTIGIALTKAAKPEFVVQKTTEIGIDNVVLFPAIHSVTKWDETKRSKNLIRLKRVAREAAMQSRRVAIPSVSFASGLPEIAHTQTAHRADFGGAPMNSGHRCIVIGPEGGWGEDEVSHVPDAVDLGVHVLRAETAALAAATLMAHLRSRAG